MADIVHQQNVPGFIHRCRRYESRRQGCVAGLMYSSRNLIFLSHVSMSGVCLLLLLPARAANTIYVDAVASWFWSIAGS